MFCGRCGSELVAGARFCSACGAPVAAAAEQGAWGGQPAGGQPVGGLDRMDRLERPRAHRMIAGVCAGLAQHYRWDLTWTRVLTVLIAVFSSGAGLVAYIVFWIVMPEQMWMLPARAGSASAAPPAGS